MSVQKSLETAGDRAPAPTAAPSRGARWVTVLLLLALFGCGSVDLHQGLSEPDTDEILVLLNQNNIEAKKEKVVAGQEVSWKVTVAKEDSSEARRILVGHNLPRRPELGLSGVYKDKGLIPTPDEQKARFLLALKGEIVNSLRKIPGVTDADVVLNIPLENEFSDLDPTTRRPTASVVVRTRNDPEVAQSVTEAKVQRFVANSVQELDPNDVAVIIARSGQRGGGSEAGVAGGNGGPPTPPEVGEAGAPAGPVTELAGLKIAPGSVGRFKSYMVSLLLVLVIVSAALLITIVRLNRMKVRLQRADEVAGEPPQLNPGPGR